MGLIWVLAPLHLSCVTLGKLLLFSEMHCSLMEKTLILKIIVNISNSILGLSYIIISMPFLFHYSFNNLENISALLKFKLFWFGTLPTWQNYDNVEGSICSAKISRIRVILFTLIQILSQDYDSVFESLAATPSHVVQIRLKRACLGAVLPVSILEKEICEPSLFGGSWFFFFFFLALALSQLLHGKSEFYIIKKLILYHWRISILQKFLNFSDIVISLNG